MAEGSALRSLLAYFKIQVDDADLKKANSAIESFNGRLKTVARTAAVAFVLKGFKDFVDDQIEAAQQLKITAIRVGTTTDQLQAMQLVARESGVPIEALSNGLRFLNRNLGEIAIGRGRQASAEFSRLGISVKDADGKARPAVDVMSDLADKIAAIPDAAERTNTAMTLLGRGGAQLIPILEQGGQAFRDAAKDQELLGGGLSEDFVRAASEARTAGVRLDVALTGLGSAIVGALLPGIKSNYEWFTKLTTSTIKFAKETTWLGSMILAVKSIIVGLAVWWAAANIPIIAAAAAVAALYLAFDDLYAFLNGNASIIGDTIDHFFGLGTAAKVAKDLNEAFQSTIEIVKIVGEEIVDDVITPLKAGYALLRGDVKGAQEIADASAGGQKDRGERLEDAVNLTAKQRRQKYGQGEFAPVPFGPPEVDEKGNPVVRQPATRKTIWGDNVPIQYLPKSPPASQTAGRKSAPAVHQNITYHIAVDAKGATNPKAVGNAVGQGVSTEQQRNNTAAFAVVNPP